MNGNLKKKKHVNQGSYQTQTHQLKVSDWTAYI